MISLSELALLEFPDLNRVDFHGGLVRGGVVPSGVPRAVGVPEGVDGVLVEVRPGLAALTVGEVAVRATDSDVEDQIEVLVERSIDILLVGPRVVTGGPSASLPEGLG